MKKNKIVKRFGVLSLCLSTAISAFSGITLPNNNVAVAAELETIQTTDFVYTGAEVTQEMNGLRISSDNAYQATFKGVFTGDTTFKFRFPESYTDALYGDFTFRITDATDDSKYFDITYYVENEEYFATALYVQYQDEIRMSNDRAAPSWFNTKITGRQNHKFAPCFLSKAYDETKNKRFGSLSLEWMDGILSVSSNTTGLQKESTMLTIASFDDTYDTSKPNNGFQDQVSWGLPKINFENGYTVSISSSIEDKRTADKGSDVLFSSITNDGKTYNFKQDTLTRDNKMEAFDNSFKFLTTKQTAEGKVFLGWQNTKTNKLYPAYSIVRKGETYEQVSLGFDIVDGASVRIDTSENGRSGLRFQTLFTANEYEAIKEAGFLKSFGTLVAWTDTLTKGDFTIENYQSESTFAQVQNTKGTFEYTDSDGEKYAAYSMAVYVDPDHFTMEYSARGYLVIEYADGSTRTIYTDYNAEDNSCAIAEIANDFKTKNPDVYKAMTQAQKDVIDAYVTSYLERTNG